MFSPHGAMSVMRHWEFTLVLDNSGASVGISLGQSGTEKKMQNTLIRYNSKNAREREDFVFD